MKSWSVPTSFEKIKNHQFHHWMIWLPFILAAGALFFFFRLVSPVNAQPEVASTVTAQEASQNLSVGTDQEVFNPVVPDGDPAFGTRRKIGPRNAATNALAVGDLNDDGILDVIVGNNHEQNVVYLNSGNSTFPVTTTIGAGVDNTTSLAVGDVNGDGNLDIVAGNSGGLSTVYFNDGTGHFPTRLDFGSGADQTESIALGDMNGDGYLDIIMGKIGPSYVYFNNGNGSFPTRVQFGTGFDTTRSVILGDINGDGFLDIVAGNYGQQSKVYLNNGMGNFTSTVNFGAGTDATVAVAVGDLNNDGFLDIVAGNLLEQNVVYFNDGSGNFLTSQDFGNGIEATVCLAVGDLNGDGNLDIAEGNNLEQNVVYLNDGSGNFTVTRNFGTGSDATYSLLAADMDNDGNLDLVTGNFNQQNVIYLNDGAGSFVTTSAFGSGSDATQGVAVGDLNSDGFLDLVVANIGQSKIYLNDGNGDFTVSRNVGPSVYTTTSVVVADLNGDLALDIVFGFDGGQNTIYFNDGAGFFNSSQTFGPPGLATHSLAVGDVNGDSYLDIVVGNFEQPNYVYFNTGAGVFPTSREFGVGDDWTEAVKLGDMNSDGALDIVCGNSGELSAVYLNDGNGNLDTSVSFGTGLEYIISLAVGDVNGDGNLDIVTGNLSEESNIFLNDGAANFSENRAYGSGSDVFTDVALADVNGDGNLDIIAANFMLQSAVFLNDGMGNFPSSRTFGPGSGNTQTIAVGDIDRDGDLDVVAGDFQDQSMIYLNAGRAVGPINNNPTVSVRRPLSTGDADFYSSHQILTNQYIPVTYKLYDAESDPVGQVKVFYSLDGGGLWSRAIAAAGTITQNLGTSPLGIDHIFTWDTFTSGFFGESNNVVLRFVVYPLMPDFPAAGTYLYPNRAAGPYQWSSASITTFPFRVRGTQVQVISGTLPVEGAVVYRIPASRPQGDAIADRAGEPYRTDVLGFLQGRGILNPGDRLVALMPITNTESYELYYTNATPTATGVDTFVVSQMGVQTLTVSANNPLVLFNLKVSLEWDARYDQQYLEQLDYDFQRASEVLYDWTNGQAAIGTITIYFERQHWLDAHIRIYASNRVRPSAAQGGISTQVITDTDILTVTYAPGQLQMGPTWSRYGEPGGTISDDWPRTLAHELGHYAFFLDDNYLGLDTNGRLIPVTGCSGAMSDPYRKDAPYDEYHPVSGWLPSCEQTLSNQTTGRADWATITTYYPWLSAYAAANNDGPATLPMAVTQITAEAPLTPTQALEDPTFYLLQDGQRVQPGLTTRAFLYQGNWVTDLGRPTRDYVLARGAAAGDRLCVYEIGANRSGCKTIVPFDDQLELSWFTNWQPEVMVTPVTSRTLVITVTNVSNGLAISGRLYPVDDPAGSEVAFSEVSGGYAATFTTVQPAMAGYIQLWVNETAPRREVITDFSLGGNPGLIRGRGGLIRGRGGLIRGRGAPAASADGQVMIFGKNLNFNRGEFYTLQSATSVPSPLPWTTMVGAAYRLTATPHAPNLIGTSISFSYLGSEVPPGEEDWLRVYYWDGSAWHILPTNLDTYHNTASAPTQGIGLYALLASIELPLTGPGWNLFAYPVQATRTVTEALLSVSGYYTTVYGYDASDINDPWKVFDINSPGWVNDLRNMEYGHGYWINVSQGITLYLGGAAAEGDLASELIHFPSLAAPAIYGYPPSTFYGQVLASSGLTPVPGMEVTAWIGGNLCGQGDTLEVDGLVVYTVNVFAAGDGRNGCGVPGSEVNFRVESQAMSTRVMWDNNRVQQVPLEVEISWKIFLPLIDRSYAALKSLFTGR